MCAVHGTAAATSASSLALCLTGNLRFANANAAAQRTGQNRCDVNCEPMAVPIIRMNYYWPIALGFELEAKAVIGNDRVGSLCASDKSMPLISATREIIHQLAFGGVRNAGSLV